MAATPDTSLAHSSPRLHVGPRPGPRLHARERTRTDERARPKKKWDPFAPVNVQPDGRNYRKTRFDLRFGGNVEAEWMWVEVASLSDRHGILTNDSVWIDGLGRGARVHFRLIPKGRPLAGCAVATEWTPPA